MMATKWSKSRFAGLSGVFALILIVLFQNCSSGGFESLHLKLDQLAEGSHEPEVTADPKDPLSIVSFEVGNSTVSPGEKISFKAVIQYTGDAPLSADKQLFIHFVSSSRPEWFEFSVFPVSGPISSTWQGQVTFTGDATIPATASGTYNVQVGINDGSATGESANIKLGHAGGMVETFGAGAIGYRYNVGTIVVATPTPTPTPTPIPPSGQINSLQTVIDDMRLDGDYESRRHNAHATIVVGSTDSLRLVSRPGRTVNFADTVNAVQPWFWIFANPISSSSNSAVQARFGECWFLRKSTNKWERLGGGRPSGVENRYRISSGLQETAESKGQTVVSPDIVQVTPGVISTEYLRVYELWFPGCAQPKREVIGHDIKAIFATVQARLVLIDSSKPDDRAKAKFTAQLGFDFWNFNRTADDLALKEDANGNPIDTTGGWKPGYPRHQMDGGCARFKWITNEWQSFNVVSIQPKYKGALPPPMGASNWSTPNPYDVPPYVLTLDELRANPPPGFEP